MAGEEALESKLCGKRRLDKITNTQHGVAVRLADPSPLLHEHVSVYMK